MDRRPSPGSKWIRSLFSIRFIVSLVAALLTGASVLLIGIISENRIRHTLSEEIKQRLAVEAKHMALVSSAELLHEFPQLTLHTVVKNLLDTNPTLTHAVVVDHEGVIQGHDNVRMLGQPYEPLPDLRPVEDASFVSSRILANPQMLVASAHALGPSGERIGTVYMGISRDHIDDLVTASRTKILVAVGLCLVLGVVMTSIVTSRLLRPIGTLKAGLARIGRGDFDTPVPQSSRTDLGLLANAINDTANQLRIAKMKMMERDAALSEAHEQLQLHVNELHEEMKERQRAEAALRLSEEKLMQSQKMEAIGLLAGGVAHDFNNILTAIGGNASLMLRRLEEDDSITRYVREVQKAVERASNLVKKLLAFSRRQVLAPQVIQLNTIIEEMGLMLERLTSSNITIDFEPDPNLHLVKADPAEIEQVILNLVVNARDAMPDGGRIHIRTAAIDPSGDTAFHGQTGPHALITVSDQGCGMDDETKQRIFEPFYTTKPKDKGTGLGLSTVYGIVKQSGGDIAVESEPGRGTLFRILLPAATESADSRPQDPAIPLRPGKVVLVVDDEAQVRDFVTAVLSDAGFSVMTATNGREALGVAKAHSRELALMITDVMMPEMNGIEACQRILEISPEIRVIFMSGYLASEEVRKQILDGPFAFIQKPFLPETLLGLVREAVGQWEGEQAA